MHDGLFPLQKRREESERSNGGPVALQKQRAGALKAVQA